MRVGIGKLKAIYISHDVRAVREPQSNLITDAKSFISGWHDTRNEN